MIFADPKDISDRIRQANLPQEDQDRLTARAQMDAESAMLNIGGATGGVSRVGKNLLNRLMAANTTKKVKQILGNIDNKVAKRIAEEVDPKRISRIISASMRQPKNVENVPQIPRAVSNTESGGNVWAELDMAEAGTRIRTPLS